jgi:hypothetical protein
MASRDRLQKTLQFWHAQQRQQDNIVTLSFNATAMSLVIFRQIFAQDGSYGMTHLGLPWSILNF